MFEENGAQRVNEQNSTSSWVIIAGAFLMLATLGGLIYFFITSAQ